MNKRWLGIAAIMAVLGGCGGADNPDGLSSFSPTPTPTPTPSSTATATGCSLRDRQNWAFAQLQEWYLFPETLPSSLDPTPYASVEDYIDALTATARAQGRDRYFTYLTSIAAENAYYSSGASAGFGIRLAADAATGRVFIAESFENAPALAAGIDRGAEILAIGTSSADLKSVSSIIAASGTAGITDALGPSTAGTTRVLRVTDAAGQRDVTLTKTDYALDPVSSRYGARIITDAGVKVGYVNLRTFIDTADPELRQAFASFKAAGVTNVIVDLRYNGGGLVSIAELVGDLLGGARSTSDVLDYTTFRPEKAANNVTRTFQPNINSIAPTKVAFIGAAGTASASELTINAQVPYLHANAALIGTNTYGKPVGQIAIDRSQCDDRFRIIAFALQNAAHQGGYFNGLAGVVEASCQAGDDYAHQLGDPAEASTRQALDFIEGVGSCTRIPAGASAQAAAASRRVLLTPDRPTATQRETPGTF
jgi:carboxyl-terminal processing protease